MTDGGEPAGATTPSMPEATAITRRELRWLVLAAAVAAVALAALSELRFEELYVTTWDFGIYQQAIYSTSHGRPFYETADLATGGFGSFLQVHSAFLLYAVVPFYAVFPDPLTLFAIQAAVVAAAAIPLYFLARTGGALPRRALGLAGLYLVAAPTVASTLYDFHIESFVPLVYLSVAFLWASRRYRWGALAALIGFLTMEVVPVLLFFLALYFLLLRESELPRYEALTRRSLRAWVARGRRLLLDPGARPTWLLLGACVFAYYALLALRYYLLADWFGFPSYPSFNSGYVVGATPGELGLSIGYLATGFYSKVSYWVLLFVLVGFLPFWAPRAWLLSLPWIAFTLLSWDTNYTVLGFQYGFIAGATLFAGAALGVSRASLPWGRGSSASSATELAPRSRRGRWKEIVTPVRFAFVALIVLNVAVSPLDPLLSNAAPGAAYNIVYSAPPSLAGVVGLAGLVPDNATVVASNDLFPLVANDLNAYSLFWGPNPELQLPFSLEHLPEFALLSEDRLNAVPPWLSDTVYVPTDFGVRGVAWTSAVGTLLLFERGYSGSIAYWGTPPSTSVTIDASQLSLDATSKLIYGNSSPVEPVAVSVNGATGELWSGPGRSLPIGNYSMTFWVRAQSPVGLPPPSPSEIVFGVSASPFAQPSLFAATANWSAIGTVGFEPVFVHFQVAEPIVDLILHGYSYDPDITIELAAASLGPSGLHLGY